MSACPWINVTSVKAKGCECGTVLQSVLLNKELATLQKRMWTVKAACMARGGGDVGGGFTGAGCIASSVLSIQCDSTD